MLDKRLMAIAGLVRKNSFVCDVGTDHAYLPCYLVKEGITSKCVACDINPMPLSKAQEHIKRFELENSIETILSNGLENVPENKADDIIIAGMGGELISRILLDSNYTRNTSKRFILQPMSQVNFLRDSLYKNGFKIDEEIPVIDKNHIYTVISASYVGEAEIKDEFFLSVGKIPLQKTIEAQLYIKAQYDKYINIANGMKISGENKARAQQYYDLAQQISNLIEL